MPRRRLTQGQRLEIARERADGVAVAELAARFEVSRQTIHAATRQLRDAPAVQGADTQAIGVRVSSRALRDFDVAIGRHGLTRSEALKRLMGAAGTMLAPDDDSAEGLRQLGAAVNRIGGNLNQIARACNEARLKGQRLPYTAQSHAEVRAAVAVVLEVVAQVQQMARSRRGQLDVVVGQALKGEVRDEGGDAGA